MGEIEMILIGVSILCGLAVAVLGMVSMYYKGYLTGFRKCSELDDEIIKELQKEFLTAMDKVVELSNKI